MIMRPHSHNSTALPEIAGWLLDLAIRLIARLLQMPAPLVQAASLFVFAQVQEADRRLLALCRLSR
jgi:hypothetical protein